jgi:hypothetical protein
VAFGGIDGQLDSPLRAVRAGKVSILLAPGLL